MNTLTLLNDAKYFDEGNARFAELRQLLDSKHAKEKLEAMKRLMAMVTIGRDVSSFFADVVKNVGVESQEVKKLVYMYLVHYAEQKQELALLSINTFQKDLASHSQRVRANAMKAMASIRLPVAVPLVMLALKAAVKDPSSYVRRAAASAIPKVYSVDPEQHELLVELIQDLLAQNEPLVLGSAIFAFKAVCPERLDLLHAHFRKICHLLADFDEWGQIITLDLLLRYGRVQFLAPPGGTQDAQPLGADPDTFASDDIGSSPVAAASHSYAATSSVAPAANSGSSSSTRAKAAAKAAAFYSDEEESDASSSSGSSSGSDSDSDASSRKRRDKKKKRSKGSPSKDAADAFSSLTSFASNANKAPARLASPLSSHGDDRALDEDHRLLLKQASQLLQSSNTGVIVAVTSLMWSLAPRDELPKVIRPLVRLSRNKRNMQYIVLTNIASMSARTPLLFCPYLKDFFVYAHEPRYIKLLKLDILAAITSEASIGTVLKEVAAYTNDPDKTFVIAAVTAIGRVAQALPGIAQRCIRGLMNLVNTSSHAGVVAQSIVVIRQLLQSNVGNISARLLQQLARLLEGTTIESADARLAIVWMVGEYRDKIPRLAPDVLRKLAASFPGEADVVKAQILNLALKLFLSNPRQTSTLFKYVMDLCKYDRNIDVRDRARMMRAIFFKKKAAAAADGAAATPVRDAGNDVKEFFKQNLLTEKPAPKAAQPFAGRDRWILGTLSHALNMHVPGYKELPPFPLVAPDPSTRHPKIAPTANSVAEKAKAARAAQQSKSRKGGRSDSESASGSGSDSDASSQHSHGSEFSTFGSESERSSRSSSRSSRRSSRSGSSRSRSSSGSRSRSDSGSGSASGSASGSDSDSAARRRRRKQKSRSPPKKASRRRRSASSSRSPSRSPLAASSASPAGSPGAGFLDLLDLKGLDLSSQAVNDPNLANDGFSALGEAHIQFGVAAAGRQGALGGPDDLLSPQGAFSPASSTPAAASGPAKSQGQSAEDAILARAFGPPPSVFRK